MTLRRGRPAASLRSALQRLGGPGLSARLARGTLWSLGSATLVRGLGLLGTMWAARLLGPEALGQVGVVQQLAALLGTLAGVGVGTTASRFVAASAQGRPDAAGRVLGATAAWSWVSGLLGGLLLALAAPTLAAGPLSDATLKPALWAAVPLLVFSLTAQAQAGALAGLDAFGALARSQALAGVAGVGLQVLGAWLGGVAGLVLALGAAEALRWALGRRVLQQVLQSRGLRWQRPRRAEVAALLRFGLPSMVSGLLVGPVLLASFAIVGRVQGGYAEVGLFQATQQFRNIVIFVAVQAAAAIVPVLAAAHAAGDAQALALALRRALAAAGLSSVLLALLLAAAAPWAMAGFGRAFAGHAALLWWLAVLAPMQALNAAGSAALSALDRPWSLLAATGLFAAVALGVVLLWPSALGLVLSQGLGSLVALVVMAVVLRPAWQARAAGVGP